MSGRLLNCFVRWSARLGEYVEVVGQASSVLRSRGFEEIGTASCSHDTGDTDTDHRSPPVCVSLPAGTAVLVARSQTSLRFDHVFARAPCSELRGSQSPSPHSSLSRRGRILVVSLIMGRWPRVTRVPLLACSSVASDQVMEELREVYRPSGKKERRSSRLSFRTLYRVCAVDH